MDRERSPNAATAPKHGELDHVGEAAVEPVEPGRRLVAEHGIGAEAEQAGRLASIEAVRRSDDAVHAWRDPGQPTSEDRGAQL